MTRDEQARALLVELAELAAAIEIGSRTYRDEQRRRAGFRDPSKGSWCAAGLTATMEDAGLVVPDPGTPARRGAIALIDWVTNKPWAKPWARSGDIIAWLQYPPSKDPAGWRRGHIAVVVAVDDGSITTVGWNEGAAPGRVMKRRLWRDPNRPCPTCKGRKTMPSSANMGVTSGMGGGLLHECRGCHGRGKVARAATVLWRRPGGLYGIARPVAAW